MQKRVIRLIALHCCLLAVVAWVNAGVGAQGVETATARFDSAATYIHGAQLRPLVEELGSRQTLNVYGPGGRVVAQLARDGDGGE